MKTDNKMEELKIKAIATREARSAAFIAFADSCLATDAAWDAYTAAATASHNAAKDYHVYEARTYGCYADEDK